MGRLLGAFRRRVLGISPDEVSFARRGFPGRDSPVRERLEEIGRTFVAGYHVGLRETRPDRLGELLGEFDNEVRGFAFEGAAMALALLDILTPWRSRRVSGLLDGPGRLHTYMVHIGVGWAMARLRRRLKDTGSGAGATVGGAIEGAVKGRLPGLDPLLGRLVADGYGFHEAFFDWRRYVEGQSVPKRLAGYDRRMFDHGVGRCLWFVDGAEVERVSKTVAAFPDQRRRDLWSGVGLACAYAGGIERASVEALREAAGSSLPFVAQGAAFAAKARERAGNPAPHTELACEILCGMSAVEAADITDAALEALPSDGGEPAFEVWRRRIQSGFAREDTGRMPAPR